MKLRIRSLESNQTHKIEIPNSYNLHQLKQSITHQLSLPSDGNLCLSLNRNHELSGSDDSLQTLGLASGDLVYYSFNSSAFKSVIVNPSNQNRDVVDFPKPNLDELVVAGDGIRELVGSVEEGCSKLANPSDKNQNFVDSANPKLVSPNLDESVVAGDGIRELVDSMEEGCSNIPNSVDETRDLGKSKMEESIDKAQPDEETAEDMEIVDDDDDEESLIEGNRKFSVPSFLKKVFVKEVGDVANGGDHKLLVIAVHAVLLESGFVAYDPISGVKFNGFHLNDEWPKSAFGLSLNYTLPEVISSKVVETVVLKFRALGKFLTVYGSVPKKGFEPYRVSLDETRFIPALSFILKNRDDIDSVKSYPNKEVFEFWKIVKDGLSYPLLIDLCEKTGLIPPSCFMLLPTDLKLNIFETLSAVDLASVSCVSSELNFLASKNELWKSKYEEEFGNSANSQIECQWKARFSSTWELRKKRKRLCMPYPLRDPSFLNPLFPSRRDPNRPFFPGQRNQNWPRIIGGDYDLFPGQIDPNFPRPFGIGGDLTPDFGIPQRHGLRNFRLNCNLGGFGP